MATTTRPELLQRLVRDLAAPGEGRDAGLKLLASVPPGESSGNRSQLAGFTFLNYDEAGAVVDLAFRTGSGGYAHLPVSMRWVDGDWKVVVPPSGDLAESVRGLPDLTGYVPWGGA